MGYDISSDGSSATAPFPFVPHQNDDTVGAGAAGLVPGVGNKPGPKVGVNPVGPYNPRGHEDYARPGESRTYTWKMRDVGTFWYHCHVMEATNHIAKGLFGAVIVYPKGWTGAKDAPTRSTGTPRRTSPTPRASTSVRTSSSCRKRCRGRGARATRRWASPPTAAWPAGPKLANMRAWNHPYLIGPFLPGEKGLIHVMNIGEDGEELAPPRPPLVPPVADLAPLAGHPEWHQTNDSEPGPGGSHAPPFNPVPFTPVAELDHTRWISSGEIMPILIQAEQPGFWFGHDHAVPQAYLGMVPWLVVKNPNGTPRPPSRTPCSSRCRTSTCASSNTPTRSRRSRRWRRCTPWARWDRCIPHPPRRPTRATRWSRCTTDPPQDRGVLRDGPDHNPVHRLSWRPPWARPAFAVPSSACCRSSDSPSWSCPWGRPTSQAAPAVPKDAPAAPPAQDVTVDVVAFHARPDRVEITTGTTVTWVNREPFDYPLVSGSHEIKADDGSFASPAMAPGTRWSHRFLLPGTFTYHCAHHTDLVGQIVVTGPPIVEDLQKEIGITEPKPDDPTTWGFQPNDLIVTTGTTVVWRNNGTNKHTVTSNDKLFESPEIAPGGTFSFTFDQPGAFGYHCTPHPWMTAAIRSLFRAGPGRYPRPRRPPRRWP